MLTYHSLFRLTSLLGAIACAVSIRADTGLHRIAPAGVKMPVTPNQAQFHLVEAFPGLLFDNPVGTVTAPGDTNRIFVIERKGRVVVIPDLSAPAKEVFLDITNRVNSQYEDPKSHGAEGICSLAFHPGWRTNGLFFLTYSIETNGMAANRISKFQISGSDPNRADPDSEQPLITQPDEGYGHNFNELRFGPDGFLYIAAGDEGDGEQKGDEFGNSQRIDKDFFSAILRIDVDGRPGSLEPNLHPASHGGYWIPVNNPYVNATSFNGEPVDPAEVRTEFYAVGFRNPWRISFDRGTGWLYSADVGLRTAEEINVVRKGGNYGWGFREGEATGPLGDPPPGVTLIPPILSYGRGYEPKEGMCVIGGFVYRGERLPQLQGQYIFGDWMSGNIWALFHDGQAVTSWTRIAGLYYISAFGEDPRNGDILICEDKLEKMTDEKIFRLEYKTGSTGIDLPETLVDAGLFSDLENLVPIEGLVPYDVNVPLWSDHAEKQRWFGMLSEEPKILFRPEGNWSFPSGTLWIKHFEMEMVEGDPASKRRLETRVLVKNDLGMHGATYRWGESNSNAVLVPEEGMDESLEITTGDSMRYQNWRYPSRSECLSCHTPSGGYALGFNTAQLHRDHEYALSTTNQIIAFRNAGYLQEETGPVRPLKRLAPLDAQEWSREYRVRSYLAANCAFCHNPSGIDRALWDGRISTPISAAGIINGDLRDSFGDVANRVIKPGSLEESVLLRRMKEMGPAHMPPLGSSEVHQEAVDLIEEWITQDLPAYRTYAEWAAEFDLGEEDGMNADPDGDEAENWLEYLVKSDPTDPADAFQIGLSQTGSRGKVSFDRAANVGFEVQKAATLSTNRVWTPLDLPANQPFFSATNLPAAVDFPLSPNQNEFFRVRVYEP